MVSEMTLSLAFIQQIGLPGLIAIAIIALLIFGKRLPDVARNLGKGIVEFKKGVKGIEEDVEDNSNQSSPPRPSVTSRDGDAGADGHHQPAGAADDQNRTT